MFESSLVYDEMMRTMGVAPQEKRNAVQLNRGSAIRGSFSPHMYNS